MKTVAIWNKNHNTPPPDAIYVGRPSRWGNPFRMEREADRFRVLARFEDYARERLQREPMWLTPLIGKDLVCWCAPKACHADILARLANEPTAASVSALAKVAE